MKISKKESKIMPRERTHHLVIQDVEQEMLVYDLDTNKAVCLNPTAKFVWRKCDGKTSVLEISKLLDKELSTEATQEVVKLALNELQKANLLEENALFVDGEPSVSRRDLIKNYGMPMVALPIVMSLVAPTAAQTTSCVPFGQPCTPTGLPCCPGGACLDSGPGIGELCQD